MARRVSTISINLSAGTGEFVADMDKAKAKVREFGGHTVSSMQASSAAIRELEGNFTNNIRAVERFMATTLQLGPALQKAFPVIGAIAFAGLVVEMGTKVYEFFKQLQEAPERMAAAFRELNAPLRATNDELRVANDRLQNDIARLEGRRQNTLKLALDEATLAADKLASSLEKDLAALNRVLSQQNVSAWSLLLGKAPTTDITKELGGTTGFG